ncbi:hypothetical protein HOI18_00340 [Candidatus Uhrbacteria bacterium]|jgi:hypothetical protein|nr:hypothetical protein [Candidatus Uhrbacteria bacterium]
MFVYFVERGGFLTAMIDLKSAGFDQVDVSALLLMDVGKLGRWTYLVAASKLDHLRASVNPTENNCVRPSGLYAVARVDLIMDVENGTMNHQAWDDEFDVHEVELFCYITVPHTLRGQMDSLSDRYAYGVWKSEDRSTSVRISGARTSTDSHRRLMRILAPSMAAARDTLLGVVKGDIAMSPLSALRVQER